MKTLLSIALAVAVSGGLTVANAADPYPPSGYEAYDPPRQLPSASFFDTDGATLSLDDFRGEVVVLNFWATWCGPCQREMPTLNVLQKRLGDKGLEVVAVSLDAKGVPAVKDFFAEKDIGALAIYNDPKWEAFKSLTTPNSGLPYTIVLDKSGAALGEVVGPATWHGPSVEQFLSDIIAEKEAALRPANESLSPPPILLAQSGDSANTDPGILYPSPLPLPLPEDGPVGSPYSRGQCSGHAVPNI
ncbi:MAG: TlpA family protein disulfide reductase [Alphaproteobacteria bacterium]|nr:TlpA family protein disulfide reductase [Alphaproteobacteria bacterium]MDA8001806.1 TlpA family protein disulfide reductase [Alphaproteobacteria bacterium]MDA8004293.1 TlpA family protein disulfide reductase [Alphaproteobacteria bacterium]MDA8006487.1 TlpA family protein disulfide reductase [Alphaproteobacteria bacterium]MDA8012827.1 TlpA family protein disulfide reductase [Alphaproteobacteria bacterium]